MKIQTTIIAGLALAVTSLIGYAELPDWYYRMQAERYLNEIREEQQRQEQELEDIRRDSRREQREREWDRFHDLIDY